MSALPPLPFRQMSPQDFAIVRPGSQYTPTVWRVEAPAGSPALSEHSGETLDTVLNVLLAHYTGVVRLRQLDLEHGTEDAFGKPTCVRDHNRRSSGSPAC